MKEAIREFFGFGELGFLREPEGYMSWQHLLSVTGFMIIMVGLAVYFGLKFKNKPESEKNKVLIWSAFLINGVELTKIILHIVDDGSIWAIFDVLPLFLCSIQLITIPLAAFSRGRLKEAALDFVFIFGVLGAVLGTYLAGNNYAAYPVFSFININSGITHSISGFAALYIVISGMTSMKKKNIPITYAILTFVSALAYAADLIGDYNYMFLMRGDGTPYDILYNIVGGNPVLYPIGVMLIFYAYILAFNLTFNLIKNLVNKKKSMAK